MIRTAGDDLEVASLLDAGDRLLFRCFLCPEGDTEMDETLIVASRHDDFVLAETIGEECVALGTLPDGTAAALGHLGAVYRLGSGGGPLVPPPAQLPRLNGWRRFGNDVFAFGSGGVLLHLDGGAWQPIALPVQASLYDMQQDRDGTLLLVGGRGTLCALRGGQAVTIDLMTNLDLHAIVPHDGGTFAIGGEGGAIFVGRNASWTHIDCGSADDISALCRFDGETYISADVQILALGGQTVRAEAELPSIDLYVAQERLWSIGLDGVHVRVDKVWQPYPIAVDVPEPGPSRVRRL